MVFLFLTVSLMQNFYCLIGKTLNFDSNACLMELVLAHSHWENTVGLSINIFHYFMLSRMLRFPLTFIFNGKHILKNLKAGRYVYCLR